MFVSHVTDSQPIDLQHDLVVIADDYMADDTGKSAVRQLLIFLSKNPRYM
jgi:hypothetical protein